MTEGAATDRQPTPELSVIVPVRDGTATLGRCLDAVARSRGVRWETIVVDDGSRDDSAAVARARAARVLRLAAQPRGPAQARNHGARYARAPLLCFLDADVLVRPETLAAFVALFAADPELAAAFGSYDAAPAAAGTLSTYRNLMHHYVHQSGREQASTFWAGCGVVRREAFLSAGGFDPRYARPSIEDIELGYRLRAAGARIRLAKHIQVTHLKRWTLAGILKTDVLDRALPWTELIVRSGTLPNDLNLDLSSRVSAAAVWLLAALLVGGRWRPWLWLAGVAPLVALLVCNRGFYGFLLRTRGPWFLMRVLPAHWLYFGYSSLSFGAGNLWYRAVTQHTGGRDSDRGGASRRAGPDATRLVG